MTSPRPAILLTVDVEDWFQVENFKPWIPYDAWDHCELRVVENTHRLLDLFDSLGARQGGRKHARGIRVTFFILGWIAARFPGLIREIHERGHEIASHGYFHRLSRGCSFGDLKIDLSESRKCLEDSIGATVFGYRAPSFSITEDLLKIVRECGYRYDSSYNSFQMDTRHGRIPLAREASNGIAVPLPGGLYELPISNLRLGKYLLPWGGGGYFRIVPFRFFRKGMKAILKKEGAYLFYMHPWEVDSGQPRLRFASPLARFRHYVNLHRTKAKLESLCGAFPDADFISCSEYLESVNPGWHSAPIESANENSHPIYSQQGA